MGLITNILAGMLQEQHPEIEVKVLHTGSKRIKSVAQSKYDDLRKVEKGYVQGVHKARKEAQK